MKQTFKINVVVTLASFLVLLGGIIFFWSFSISNDEASTINIAGRQRMLSQWLRYTWYSGGDVDPLRKELLDKHQVLKLEEGNVFVPLESKAILDQLDGVLMELDETVSVPFEGDVGIQRKVDRLVERWVLGMDEFNRSVVEAHTVLMQVVKSTYLLITSVVLGVLIYQLFVVLLPKYRKEREIHVKSVNLNKSNERVIRQLHMSNRRVVHDMKSPLQTISMNLELARTKQELGVHDVNEHLNRSLEATDFMQEMLGQLIQSQSHSSFVVKEYRMGDLVNDVLDNFKTQIEELGSEIRLDIRGKMVYADGKAIRSILQNLISNALKFRKEGQPPVINISYLEGRHSRTLTVADRGEGIAQEHLKYVFEEGYRIQSAKEGHGVGLRLVKDFVDAHGWNITVESAPGHGAVFTITMPKDD